MLEVTSNMIPKFILFPLYTCKNAIIFYTKWSIIDVLSLIDIINKYIEQYRVLIIYFVILKTAIMF